MYGMLIEWERHVLPSGRQRRHPQDVRKRTEEKIHASPATDIFVESFLLRRMEEQAMAKANQQQPSNSKTAISPSDSRRVDRNKGAADPRAHENGAPQGSAI